MIIETHAHLDFPEYDKDRKEVIERAKNAGVGIIINCSADLKGSIASVGLSREYECIYAACGIHPHSAKSLTEESFSRLRSLILSTEKVIAIGEVGLDFYRDISPRDLQYEAFVRFVRLSKEIDLPLIIHCREESPDKRDAARLIIDTLRDNLVLPVRGVVHCFSAGPELLREYLDLGLYISFTCNITYEKAQGLRQTLKGVPIDRLLLETDAPFLSPQAKRGRRNEPAHLIYLIEAISGLIGMSRQEIERITTENAKRLFNLD